MIKRHNLSPRGDGNDHVLVVFGAVQDTTYPREGTETAAPGQSGRPIPDTTYPREGTETDWPQQLQSPTADTTYPREGTETLSAHLLSSFLKTQLIPARGRKPVLFGALHHGLGHNLSPRGDGNKSSAYFPISSEGHNLSPRGDGNARNSPLIISASATQLIPARGRKLLLNATNASVSRHNLSPRGDGWAIVDIGLYYAATTKI